MTLWLIIYCVGFAVTGFVCGWNQPDLRSDGQRLAILFDCVFWFIVWPGGILYALGAFASEIVDDWRATR